MVVAAFINVPGIFRRIDVIDPPVQDTASIASKKGITKIAFFPTKNGNASVIPSSPPSTGIIPKIVAIIDPIPIQRRVCGANTATRPSVKAVSNSIEKLLILFAENTFCK